MAKGIIVLRNAGLEIPDDYLDRIVKAKPRCMGVAVVDPEKGIETARIPGVPEAKDIKQVLGQYKGTVLIHFGEYPTTYNEEDRQPFDVMYEDADPEKPVILSAALEGDFVANTSDSSHLDVWHVINDYLCPKIEEMYDLCGKDTDKLLVALRSKSFEKDLASQVKSSGSVVFLGGDGHAWTTMVGKKDHLKTDWGWLSNSLGWREPTQVDKDNATERTGPFASLKDKLSAVVGKTATAPLSSDQKPVQPPADTNPKDFPNKVVEGVDGPRRSRIPEKILRAKLRDIKKYCKNVAVGGIPPELEMDDRGNVVTDKAQVNWDKLWIITQSDNDAWKARHKPPEANAGTKLSDTSGKPQTLAQRLAAKKAATQVAAEATKTGHEEKASTAEAVKEFVPVIPPEEKSEVEEIILKALDDSGDKLPVAAHAIQSMEKKFATFTECFGVDLELVETWSSTMLHQLVQDYPVASTCLMMELITDRIRSKKPAEEEAPKPAEVAKAPMTLAEKLAAKRAAAAA